MTEEKAKDWQNKVLASREQDLQWEGVGQDIAGVYYELFRTFLFFNYAQVLL